MLRSLDMLNNRCCCQLSRCSMLPTWSWFTPGLSVQVVCGRIHLFDIICNVVH